MITSQKQCTVAVVGNPNSGKTTLFNGLTGSNHKVGNWPGVTVEKKVGSLNIDHGKIDVVDLPGIYSLSAQSEDEKVARDYILSGEPELVVNIADATNLERNLFLTLHLIEMKVPVLLVLNMLDLAGKQDIQIDEKALSEQLGIPVVGISATNQKDVARVKETIAQMASKKEEPSTAVEYPNEVEQVLESWSSKVDDVALELGADERWLALKLLEQDEWVVEKVVKLGAITEEQIDEAASKIETILADTPDVVIAEHKYGFIHSVVESTVKKGLSKVSVTERIDRVVMNRVLGIPIFLAMMYLVFWLVMNIGGAFIDFFDMFFGTIFVDGFGELLGLIRTPEWLTAILANGVGAGIQTVTTFIPIVFMMFFLLSLLEDSGYMSRAAFVMDRMLRAIGLPGKAFIPMLVGFGCTIPAVMATRTLDSKRDRFLTIFMAPFMSCGARLPVYALFTAAFFPRWAGAVVFSIYAFGIVLAVLTGLLLRNTIFKGERSNFVMELPPYHAPRFKHIMTHTWLRLKVFMFRAGKVIIIAIVLLGFLNSLGVDGSFGNEDSSNSVLSKIGVAITPVFTPMGIEKDNWPASVGLFTGLFAKEAVVGTLNSLYSQSAAAEEAEEAFSFGAGLRDAFVSIPENLAGVFGGLADPLGVAVIGAGEETTAEEVEADSGIFSTLRERFSGGPAQAYAYLLFVLIYFPCLAALGVILREVGKGYGWLSVTYLTILAWITATLFYQITVGHQALWIIVPIVMIGFIVGAFSLVKTKSSRA